MRILRLEEVTASNFPEFRTLSPEELKEAYRLSRESFTAEDLQMCIEALNSERVPAEDVLRELEETDARLDQLG
jgi:hypothetical protein